MISFEKRNLFRATPFLNKVTLVLFFLVKITKKISRAHIKVTAFYPQPILNAYKQHKKHRAMQPILTQNAMTSHAMPREWMGEEIKIKLATDYLTFKNVPHWDMVFEDSEQLVSLHRWGWLLHWFTHAVDPGNYSIGMALIDNWCTNASINLQREIYEPYTAGERICNALIYAAITKIPLAQGTRHTLLCAADRLTQTIEYYWFDQAGNHVINNARALYFAGQYFGVTTYSVLAKSILSHELARLIYHDGFLREGSSHYHFLITRWLLEIAWLAGQNNDEGLLKQMDRVLPQMVARCWFLIIPKPTPGEYTMPLIGDVSPDVTWEWLLDLPWSNLARYYHVSHQSRLRPIQRGVSAILDALAGQDMPAAAEEQPPIIRSNLFHVQSFPESGWYRVDWHEFTMVWHIEPQGTPLFASHGHCDLGSFCFYWRGQEILIDPGRLNYQLHHPLGRYGIGAAAHNSLCIDGYDPFVYLDRTHYPKTYSQKKVSVWIEHNLESFRLVIEHEGFTRLAGDTIIHRRSFDLTHDEIVMSDQLTGKNTHTVCTFFQWAPEVILRHDLRNKTYQISLLNHQFHATLKCLAEIDTYQTSIHQGQQEELTGGWTFPGYGLKIPSSTVRYEANLSLPSMVRYSIKLS